MSTGAAFCDPDNEHVRRALRRGHLTAAPQASGALKPGPGAASRYLSHTDGGNGFRISGSEARLHAVGGERGAACPINPDDISAAKRRLHMASQIFHVGDSA